MKRTEAMPSRTHHRLGARSNEGGVVGESEIVVGTEIEDLASAVDLHPPPWGDDQALGLPESVSRIWSRVVDLVVERTRLTGSLIRGRRAAPGRARRRGW